MCRLRPILALSAALLAAVAALPAEAQGDGKAEQFEAIRAADLRLAAVGWRLATANVALCARREPGIGLQLHTLDQFDGGDRAAAQAYFRFATPVAIEGVVAGSPADLAGLKPDDSLVRIGTVDIAALPGAAGTTQRLVAAQLAIAALPPDAPMTIRVLRNGTALDRIVQPVPACRSRFELRLASDLGASADGTMVQISLRFLEVYPADQFAAVVAHEFAHNVLHHRDRLEARGVAFGMLAGFGGNVKYFRQTEVQADLLSLYLLANAGYSPRASIAFWQHFGPSKAGGIFRSRSHPHWRDRIATMAAEIAKIDAVAARPIVPGLIAERDQPLSGDWQSILIRHR